MSKKVLFAIGVVALMLVVANAAVLQRAGGLALGHTAAESRWESA